MVGYSGEIDHEEDLEALFMRVGQEGKVTNWYKLQNNIFRINIQFYKNVLYCYNEC